MLLKTFVDQKKNGGDTDTSRAIQKESFLSLKVIKHILQITISDSTAKKGLTKSNKDSWIL